VPRDDVVIATKIMSRTARRVTLDIERFLRELDTDVLDIVLLHSMTYADWPQRYAAAAEALVRAKEQGKVRAVGVSCHGLESLRAAKGADWIEVVLARINSAGVHMGAPPTKQVPVIETLHAAGKAVYGMKVLGCGQLAGRAHRAIEYVLQLGVVHAMAIGMSTRKQLDQNVKIVEALAPQYPLRRTG
jgi:aryl-alcohol dehydrogenase-like predicted oxidoreductase